LPDTEIEYEGDRYFINYRKKGNKLIFVEGKNTSYIVPKLMYIPAERNFLSTIKDAFNVKGLPEHLFTFAEELRKAQKQSNGRSIELPIKNYSYEYDEQTESSFLYNKNHRINLMQASSGFQSLIPLFLVTRYLINLIEKSKESPRESMSVNQSIRMSEEITNITLNSSLSINEKQQQLNKVKSKYINRCLFSIIEEPEQNLFPSSQRLILNSILAFNKRPSTNKLIITTHSPYIINYLTLAVQAHSLKNKLKYESVNDPVSLLSRLNGIVPTTATIKQEDLVIYEMNDLNGSITKLGNFEGIPSDKNYLNQSLRRGNEMFDSLLAIEQEL
jgi:predicted ATPase